jgi:hypothetical protein
MVRGRLCFTTTVPREGDGALMEASPMSEPVGATCVERDIDALHHHFLAILPRIQTHAEIYFRHLRCPGRRADAIAETVAISWRWFLRLTEQGKDINEFASAVANFAVKHVRSGRRLCGAERSRDVLSKLAQQRHHFKVEPLVLSSRRDHESIYSDLCGQHMAAYEERLRDNMQSPVPDQAAFRVDYPEWLAQLGPRSREIVADMTLDHSTNELAAMHKLTAGRISQLRRELHQNWQRFHSEPC